MRFRVLSDLHLEASPYVWSSVGEDVLFLAGDVADSSPIGISRRLELRESIAKSNIMTFYVLGNHEGYGDWIAKDALRERIRAELPSNIHLLDRSGVDLDCARVVGCTLWTDFSHSYGIERHGIPVDPATAMRIAELAIGDFKYLCLPQNQGEQLRRVTALEMAAWHQTERVWLDREIAVTDRPMIVMTHFPPCAKSIHPRYRDNILNPYFAPDCRKLLRSPVSIWIHGHLHMSSNYVANKVRIFCNPRGYGGAGGILNPDFREDLVISL